MNQKYFSNMYRKIFKIIDWILFPKNIRKSPMFNKHSFIVKVVINERYDNITRFFDTEEEAQQFLEKEKITKFDIKNEKDKWKLEYLKFYSYKSEYHDFAMIDKESMVAVTADVLFAEINKRVLDNIRKKIYPEVLDNDVRIIWISKIH